MDGRQTDVKLWMMKSIRRETLEVNYKIVVPSFNSVDWIEQTLKSIEGQTVSRYEVCVVDDASTLPEQREIISKYCDKNGWKARFHKENHGALHGIVHAIRDLNCSDEDVVILVDGDDWLAHSQVLERLDRAYADPAVYFTWGQFRVHPEGWLPIRYAQAIPREVISEQKTREYPWICWPLRTFKVHLWNKIRDDDLRDAEGNYYRFSWDQAIYLPMLDMAGNHGCFIPDVLYVYNLENPLSDFKISPEEQEEATAAIRNQAPYSKL